MKARSTLAPLPISTEGDIWSRLLWPDDTLSLAGARSLLRLEFATEDTVRMNELAAKARDGTLTRTEKEEIREYERAGNLLALMKSKARMRLMNLGRDE